jgi:hypothetical protein
LATSLAAATTTSTHWPPTSATREPLSSVRTLTSPTEPRQSGGRAKCASSDPLSGAAYIAPPPKPMIAMPVAMPLRSGNQRSSVDTGDT